MLASALSRLPCVCSVASVLSMLLNSFSSCSFFSAMIPFNSLI